MTFDLKLLARQMKALSNEHRLSLFLKILEHERQGLECSTEIPACMIGQIAAKFNLSAPTISHHIKTLENAGLIEITKHGKFISARINNVSHEHALRAFHGEDWQNFTKANHV